MASVNQVNQRYNDSDILLVGLFGILYRYQHNPSFPEQPETTYRGLHP